MQLTQVIHKLGALLHEIQKHQEICERNGQLALSSRWQTGSS